MDKLVDRLSALLLENELKLVTAESCTGGLISAAITERTGASTVFDCGFVTYSSAAKERQLGVSTNILNNYGAVSSPCAEAMAIGALSHSNADISVSVTGIAGPDGGSADKPVGLVFICIVVTGKEPQVTECNFSGSRHEIRERTCHKALSLLIETALAI